MKRKTKIVATLGPASSSRAVIGELVAAGMDVARLNFSHGTFDAHREAAARVRDAAAEAGRAVAVLQDIQGPRIRVGTFPGGSAHLELGSRVRLVDGEGAGDASAVQVRHLSAARVSAGDRVLLADGLIELTVLEADEGEVLAEVTQGGECGDHKGAAFPGIALDLPAVTDKDLRDLEFGAAIGVDLVAASFVESAADIEKVKSVAGDVPVIAKIERAAGYRNLADILTAADGAMVARGDLGVEIGLGPLPRAQKEIIATTNGAGGISITATEMLESMTSSPRPTRAEVTDVANAVLDGTDAVMLSAETAVGAYPVRSVSVMASICEEAEMTPGFAATGRAAFGAATTTFATAIAQALSDTSGSLGMGTVLAFTESGSTGRLVAKFRPDAEIVAFTPSEATYRQMAILWGVTPLLFERYSSTDEMIARAEEELLRRGIVQVGDRVAMAAGIPPNKQASTNLLKLHVIGETTSGVSGGAR